MPGQETDGMDDRERIELPGGWYFDTYRPSWGYALRDPGGRHIQNWRREDALAFAAAFQEPTLPSCDCPAGQSGWNHAGWCARGIDESRAEASAAMRSPSAALPVGQPVTLADCPIGLFRHVEHGTLALKTEYGNNEGRIDAYIVESGEFFWGSHPQTIANQRAQMVVPVELSAAPEPPAVQEPANSKSWSDQIKNAAARHVLNNAVVPPAVQEPSTPAALPVGELSNPKLPCDVLLEPATRFRKGCELRGLLKELGFDWLLSTAPEPPAAQAVNPTSEALGFWLSAALDDPHSCKEFKDAVTAWFDAGSPAFSLPTTPAQPGKPAGTAELEVDADGNVMICTGCGSSRTQASYERRGFLTCCPERKMVPARSLLSFTPPAETGADDGWRPIESAPRGGEPVDLWCVGTFVSGRVVDCWYYKGRWWRYDEAGDDQCRSEVHGATHWRRIPSYPTPKAHVDD